MTEVSPCKRGTRHMSATGTSVGHDLGQVCKRYLAKYIVLPEPPLLHRFESHLHVPMSSPLQPFALVWGRKQTPDDEDAREFWDTELLQGRRSSSSSECVLGQGRIIRPREWYFVHVQCIYAVHHILFLQ